MNRVWSFLALMVTASVFAFAGCNNEAQQEEPKVDVDIKEKPGAEEPAVDVDVKEGEAVE